MELIGETNFFNTVQVLAKAHSKKWYKKGNFELCDFGLINSHTAWNLSCERMVHIVQELRLSQKKWEFFVVAAE